MIGKAKTLVAALCALAAIAALGAPAASAGFEAEADHALLSVSSNEEMRFGFKPGSSTIACTGLSIHSTVESESTATTEITSEPTVSNCHKFLGQAMSLHTNECHYIFHLAAEQTSGTMDIACPEGKGMEMTVGSICAYSLGSQEGLESITYSNVGEGSTREVRVEPSLTGLSFTRTTNHFFCPAAGSEGVYQGDLTVTGEDEEGSHVGVWVD